ncbi:MAG: outer membrane lipoprotein chaperone LolA [Deltaproteobacteria bacterium]|nr:outer membrane lipoprotein chaperone LolA [Deltaproteobacteria bacterium]
MVKRTICYVIMLLGCVAFNSWALTVSEVVDRVEARYASPDCQAGFFQESTLKAMDITDKANGKVYFKKPDMMRWDYEAPERQTIVTDGKTLWMYRPDEAQVAVGRAADYFGGGEGLSFLSDITILRSQFQIRFLGSTSEKVRDDQYLLKLTPNVPRSNLSYLYLWISKDTFNIVRSKVFNPFGDTTMIAFENVQFNQNLKPSFFVFEVPKGTEVVEMAGEEAVQ